MHTAQSDTLHKRLIDVACRNGWVQRGWKAAIRKHINEEPWCWDAEEVLDVVHEMPCIPDAWRVRIEKPGDGSRWNYDVLVLELLEVEVTNPIDPSKLRYYVDLWWAMDSSSLFHLRVFRMDRYGFVLPLLTEHTVYDLAEGYLQEGREWYVEVPSHLESAPPNLRAILLG